MGISWDWELDCGIGKSLSRRSTVRLYLPYPPWPAVLVSPVEHPTERKEWEESCARNFNHDSRRRIRGSLGRK